MIPFSNRFHGHSSLNYVYRNGQAIHSHWLTIKVISNSHRKDSRIAVVISKKVLKGAVKRNRVRRQVYEYVSKILPELKSVYDIAIIAVSGELFTASHNAINEQLEQLFDQMDIKSSSKLL
jgi:ribonuclease P protein component